MGQVVLAGWVWRVPLHRPVSVFCISSCRPTNVTVWVPSSAREGFFQRNFSPGRGSLGGISWAFYFLYDGFCWHVKTAQAFSWVSQLICLITAGLLDGREKTHNNELKEQWVLEVKSSGCSGWKQSFGYLILGRNIKMHSNVLKSTCLLKVI